MKIGSVVGSIWATRKAACLQGQTFLVVRSGAEELVAADQVGAGPGMLAGTPQITRASRREREAPSVAAVSSKIDSKERKA